MSFLQLPSRASTCFRFSGFVTVFSGRRKLVSRRDATAQFADTKVTPKKKLSDRADHDDLFGALSTVDQSTGLEKCCARRKYTPEWYFGPISDLNAQSPFFQHGLGLLNSAEHGLRDQQDPRLCEH
jgi:hypothetical protein